MTTESLDYKYVRAHYDYGLTWYRELVWLDQKLVGEICESTDSSPKHRIYQVRKYTPLKVFDGSVDVAKIMTTFSTVVDCKEFINNGGIQ